MLIMKPYAPAAIALGSLLLLAGCIQSLFYQPDRILYETPVQAGLRFEQVSFRSKDGTRLAGWMLPSAIHRDPRNAKGTVVHFHGNAQNMSTHWRLVEWLPRRGFNVFVFDYRGYGASDGSPEPRGVFEDSSSALDYVRSRPDIDPERLLILGQSLGGANAIAVLGSGNRQGVRGIVIETAFSSYSAIASDKVSGAGVFMDDSFSPDRFVANLSPTPFLLIHGTADAVIPFHHATKLMAGAREPKRLVTIEGGGHNEAFSGRFGPKYMDIVTAFFDDVLPAP
jgi:fermentation-respiration switch protein FrsA (DUF1100 family)